jgi:hypothetical protein
MRVELSSAARTRLSPTSTWALVQVAWRSLGWSACQPGSANCQAATSSAAGVAAAAKASGRRLAQMTSPM